MFIAPDLAQQCINFLNRVPTTGLDEAALLTACAEGLKAAGEAGVIKMREDAEAAKAEAEAETKKK